MLPNALLEWSLVNMLESFMRRLSRKFGNIVRIFYSEDVDEGILDSEKNLYKRGIFRHAKTIEEFVNGDSTSGDLADAIAKYVVDCGTSDLTLIYLQ